MIPDLVAGRVNLAKRPSYSRDRGLNIFSSILTLACGRKTPEAKAIANHLVRHTLRDIRSEQQDRVAFFERKVHVLDVPIGPSRIRVKN
jgi:hypothetical protein